MSSENRREDFTHGQQTADMSVGRQRERTSMAVVEAISDELGVGPMEIDPLATTIDPDALDRLFESVSGEVTFTHAGVRVAVSKEGVHVVR
jgi:hypothetical protein